jgi:putative transposase
VPEVTTYIEQHFQVRFKFEQSYYEPFNQAGFSWKKSQARNPKADPE